MPHRVSFKDDVPPSPSQIAGSGDYAALLRMTDHARGQLQARLAARDAKGEAPSAPVNTETGAQIASTSTRHRYPHQKSARGSEIRTDKVRDRASSIPPSSGHHSARGGPGGSPKRSSKASRGDGNSSKGKGQEAPSATAPSATGARAPSDEAARGKAGGGRSELNLRPYVDIFQSLGVERGKGCTTVGDVTSAMDRAIRRRAWRVWGAVPAANVLQVPRGRNASLGLTGRFLYALVRPVIGRYFMLHIDVHTEYSLVCRISVSNLYKKMKAEQTSIQYPCSDLGGRWSVIALDLEAIVRNIAGKKYLGVRQVQLCSCLFVRSLVISDHRFDGPSLPRHVQYHVPAGSEWGDLYAFQWYPLAPVAVAEPPVHGSAEAVAEALGLPPAKLLAAGTRQIAVAAPRSVRAASARGPSGQVGGAGAAGGNTGSGAGRPSVRAGPTSAAAAADRQRRSLEASMRRPVDSDFDLGDALAPEANERVVAANRPSLHPDPIMSLRRVIGLSGHLSDAARWLPDHSAFVFACSNVLVLQDASSGEQRHFLGHTTAISCFDISRDGTMIATGSEGRDPATRVWDVHSGTCLAVTVGHSQDVSSLAFSPSSLRLVSAGRDAHAKDQICSWDLSQLRRTGRMKLLSRQLSDVDIARVVFSPYETSEIVTCGRNSVRFWRFRDGAFRGSAVNLGDHFDAVFTALAFEGQTTATPGAVRLFAATASGMVFDVNASERTLECVYRLHNGCIRSLAVSKGYCVTGADDRHVRVWPLDFSEFVIEARHDSGVSAVSMTADSPLVLVATEAGSIGTLDLPTHACATLSRSHTGAILASAVDPARGEFATASDDGTVRVWDLDTSEQLYEFDSPGEACTALAYHPTDYVLACGYGGGALRVFDLARTALLEEYFQHAGRVSDLAYSADGSFLYTAGADGAVCMHDTRTRYTPVRLLTSPEVAGTERPVSLSASEDGSFVAVVGPDALSVVVFDARTLDVRAKLLSGKAGRVARVSFARGGTEILVTTEDGCLARLDVSSGEVLARAAAVHGGGAGSGDGSGGERALAFATDSRSRYIVSGGGDAAVKVWPYTLRAGTSGNRRGHCQVFVGHAGAVRTVAMTPDGRTVITAGDNHAIFLWGFHGSGSPGGGGGDDCDVDGAKDGEGVNGNDGKVNNGGAARDRGAGGGRDPASYRVDPRKSMQNRVGGGGAARGPAAHPSARAWDVAPAPPQGGRRTGGDGGDSRRSGRGDTGPGDLADLGADLEVGGGGRGGDGTPAAAFVEGAARPRNSAILPRPHDKTSMELARRRAREVRDAASRHASSVLGSLHDLEARVTSLPFCHGLAHRARHPLALERFVAPPGEAALVQRTTVGFTSDGHNNVCWFPETGILAYSAGCEVILEDLVNYRQRQLHGHVYPVTTLALSSTGRRLASASSVAVDASSSAVRVWDTARAECVMTLTHHVAGVQTVGFTDNERYLATCGSFMDASVAVWDLVTGSLVASCEVDAPINVLRWVPRSDTEFITAGEGREVVFWLRDGAALRVHRAAWPRDRVLEREREAASKVGAFHGTAIDFYGSAAAAVASNTGLISIWDLHNNAHVTTLASRTSDEIDVLSWHGDRLIASGTSARVEVWPVAPGSAASFPSIRPGSSTYAAAQLDGAAVGWSFDDANAEGVVATSGGSIWYLNLAEDSATRIASGHAGDVAGVAWLGDESSFASAGADGTLRVWASASCQQQMQFQDAPGTECTAASAPRLPGEHVAAAGFADGTVRVYHTLTGVCQLRVSAHPDQRVTALAFVAEDEYIVSCSNRGHVVVIDRTEAVVCQQFLDPHGGFQIDAIAAGAAGDPGLFATVSRDAVVCVWRLDAERQELAQVAVASMDDASGLGIATRPALIALNPDPDTTELVYVSAVVPSAGEGAGRDGGDPVEGRIVIYDYTLGVVARTLPLNSVAMALDVNAAGDLLAVGTEDRLVKVIDFREGTFQDYVAHADTVTGVRFSPSGRQLLSCGGDDVILWNVAE